VPNVLTVTRLALLPVYVSWMADHRYVAGAWFLGALMWTDFFDGWIARRFDQGSELGKILDPVADRAIFVVGVLASIAYGAFPVWFGVLVLAREVSIALMMSVATLMGMERFPVTTAGKRATFAMMSSVSWLTLGAGGGVWVVARWMGWTVGIPGIVLSYVTLLQYVPLVRRHLSAGRAARRLP
jgi:cardiolipin synthase